MLRPKVSVLTFRETRTDTRTRGAATPSKQDVITGDHTRKISIPSKRYEIMEMGENVRTTTATEEAVVCESAMDELCRDR